MKHKPAFGIFALILLLLLSSCIGINADITLNQNGSGTIHLEYQISKALDSLGRLDGNERWNTIPVGRADFERTIDRLPEIKLVSYSSKEDEKNLNISVKLEFSSMKGLLAFFDAGGRRSVFSGDSHSGRLALTLSEGGEHKNPGLAKLISNISETYSVKMSMTFPGTGSLSVSDSRGNPVKTGNDFTANGKTVSCSFPLNDILSSEAGIVLAFSF